MVPKTDCPNCGERIDVASDDDYVVCPHCEKRVKNPLSTFGT